MFLDLLIFIIQFSFISLPKLVLPEPSSENSSNCPAMSDTDYTENKSTGNLIVDFMTGQVSLMVQVAY